MRIGSGDKLYQGKVQLYTNPHMQRLFNFFYYSDFYIPNIVFCLGDIDYSPFPVIMVSSSSEIPTGISFDSDNTSGFNDHDNSTRKK